MWCQEALAGVYPVVALEEAWDMSGFMSCFCLLPCKLTLCLLLQALVSKGELVQVLFTRCEGDRVFEVLFPFSLK